MDLTNHWLFLQVIAFGGQGDGSSGFLQRRGRISYSIISELHVRALLANAVSGQICLPYGGFLVCLFVNFEVDVSNFKGCGGCCMPLDSA